MSEIVTVADARRAEAVGREVVLRGWVRTRRDSKAGLSFIEINDGSCFGNVQVIAESGLPNYESEIKRLSPGCSVSVTGLVKPSPGKGQATEVHATAVAGPRHGRRGELSAPEEGPFAGVPPHHRPSAAADQHLRGRRPGEELRLQLDPPVLPGAGLPLRPHADHHRQRLRRGRGHVPGHHALDASAASPLGEGQGVRAAADVPIHPHPNPLPKPSGPRPAWISPSISSTARPI